MFPQVPFGFQQKPIHFANGSVIQGISELIGTAIRGTFASGGVINKRSDVAGAGRIVNLFTALGDITLNKTNVAGEVLTNVIFGNGEITSSPTDVMGAGITRLPYNNNFADRFTLVGVPVTVTANNQAATGEAGEPTLSGAIESLWWQWTPPYSATFNVNTQGSDFDTYMGIYTSSLPNPNVNNLTLIYADDDSGGGATSLIVRYFTYGVTYYIRVEGYSSARGNITLRILPY